MLNIKISFLSLLKDITKQEELTLLVNENSSIREILNQLIVKYGEEFEKIVFNSPNNLSKYIILSLNGENISNFEDLTIKLQDGDDLIFLPAIAGG